MQYEFTAAVEYDEQWVLDLVPSIVPWVRLGHRTTEIQEAELAIW